MVVEMPDGTRFSVGTGFTDAERRSPPPIGVLITYRYQELTDRGVPRFPTFLRVRSDLNPPDWTALSTAVAPVKPPQAPKSSRPAVKAAAPKPPPAAAPSAAPRATKAFKTLCISGRLDSGLRKADYASALIIIGFTNIRY